MHSLKTPTITSTDDVADTTKVTGSPDGPIVRALAGLAVMGSGLVHFAIAPQQSIFLTILLSGLAAGELVLALGILAHRLRITAPAAILVSVPTIVWALVTLVGNKAGLLPLGPMFTASALGLFAALLLAVSPRFRTSPRAATRPWTFATALVVGAIVLPMVAVPAIVEAQYPSVGQPANTQPSGHHH